MALTKTLLDLWYHKRRAWLSLLLLPLAGFFHFLITLRRAWYRWKAADKVPLPVVVVGNINLGGSGKSPLLIALAKALRERGLAPGVISRGYGSTAPSYPYEVRPDSDTQTAGDEPVMIARRAECPVVVDARRVAAAERLVANGDCDVILSDDGLQHYALLRDLEIVVIDGQRLLGNELLLPAGPLREPSRRLREVDWVVINGALSEESRLELRRRWRLEKLYQMELRPASWRRVFDGKSYPLEQAPWLGTEGAVHALAGIGNPERFFSSLRELGASVIAHSFPDHHDFSRTDLEFGDERSVLMTEKDAVKCQPLLAEEDADKFWYLQVEAVLEPAFYESFFTRLEALRSKENALGSQTRSAQGANYSGSTNSGK